MIHLCKLDCQQNLSAFVYVVKRALCNRHCKENRSDVRTMLR